MGVPDFEWQYVSSIAGEEMIAGVDSDRAGGLWIAYYTPDRVRIVHRAASGATVADFTYPETGVRPVSGLAYTGDALWVNHVVHGGFGDHLRKLDPTTGAELDRFAAEDGIEDVDYATGELLLSKSNGFLVMDPATGGIKSRTDVSEFYLTTQRGVAAMQGKLWLAGWNTNRIVLVDRTGTVLRGGTTNLLPFTNAQPVFLAWDGSALILATTSQITWLIANVTTL